MLSLAYKEIRPLTNEARQMTQLQLRLIRLTGAGPLDFFLIIFEGTEALPEVHGAEKVFGELPFAFLPVIRLAGNIRGP